MKLDIKSIIFTLLLITFSKNFYNSEKIDSLENSTIMKIMMAQLSSKKTNPNTKDGIQKVFSLFKSIVDSEEHSIKSLKEAHKKRKYQCQLEKSQFEQNLKSYENLLKKYLIYIKYLKPLKSLISNVKRLKNIRNKFIKRKEDYANEYLQSKKEINEYNKLKKKVFSDLKCIETDLDGLYEYSIKKESDIGDQAQINLLKGDAQICYTRLSTTIKENIALIEVCSANIPDFKKTVLNTLLLVKPSKNYFENINAVKRIRHIILELGENLNEKFSYFDHHEKQLHRLQSRIYSITKLINNYRRIHIKNYKKVIKKTKCNLKKIRFSIRDTKSIIKLLNETCEIDLKNIENSIKDKEKHISDYKNAEKLFQDKKVLTEINKYYH